MDFLVELFKLHMIYFFQTEYIFITWNSTDVFPSGAHLWKGFQGPAQLSNESFKELDDIHQIGHVDAAFRMHNTDNPDDHDHIYFFLVW